MNRYAVIVCGGSASRMGNPEVNKTLMPVAGVPSVIRCLRAFSDAMCRCIVVIRPADEPLFRKALAEWHMEADIVYGGPERQFSVRNGIEAIPEDDAWVLVHDGARPMISASFVNRCMRYCEEKGSAIPAIPVTDTLKKKENGRTVTIDREGLYRTQTPQCCRLSDLKAAYLAAGGLSFTDEAALLEHAGFPAELCPGMTENIKLTVKEDLALAEKLLQKVYRTGFGMDAHRFQEGRKLVLCGVEVPNEKGLLGHSDADAPLHALTDALLGAAALGDIGKWFPDSDERYRGISSLLLLSEAAEGVRKRGWTIVSADITIVCQRPKLAPYIDQMRFVTAGALSVSKGRVSVKATTTEHMGYEGREEGISAHAVATLTCDPMMTEMEEER